MSGYIQTPSSAIEIYQSGYNNSRMGRFLDAKAYFTSLRDSVVSEYKAQGFCELIDYFIDYKEDVDIIAYAAFNDAYNCINGMGSENPGEYIPYVVLHGYGPMAQQMVTWTEWPAVRQRIESAYKFRDISNLLIGLRRVGQNAHLLYLQEMQRVQKEKEKDVKDEAKKLADMIIEEAQQTAIKIIEDAKEQAGKESLAASKASENNCSTEAARNVSEALIRKYLNDDRVEFKRLLEKDLLDTISESKNMLGKAEAIHDDMCDQTNTLQASWVTALTSAIDELSKIKEEFYRHLHNWQISLYPHELRPLAERYIELYRIINVDKLLTEEILLHSVSKKEGETDSIVQNNLSERGLGDVPFSPTIEGLKKINRTLTTFLHKFELSLNGLDLYVYYPSEGETFDNVWHVMEDDTEYNDFNGYKISRCVVPGIAKKINDSTEDDVIIPAIVLV